MSRYDFSNVAFLKNYAVNKILPLVYDDSLSYYEVLCKVMGTVNKIITNEEELQNALNELGETVQTFDGRIENVETRMDTYSEKITRLEQFQEQASEDIDNLLEALAGGRTGQILVKNGNGDLEFNWEFPEKELPVGGTTGQILTKKSNEDDDVEWTDAVAENGVPEEGTTGQVLRKASNDDYDSEWSDIREVPTGGSQGNVLTKQADGTYDWDSAPSGTIPAGGIRGQVLTKFSNDVGDYGWQAGSQALNGLPTGGSQGQVLNKKSAQDFDAEWVDLPSGVPAGGTTGQGLVKKSNADGDVKWESLADPQALVPTGGQTGQSLRKHSNSSYDLEWYTPANPQAVLPAGGVQGQYLIKAGNDNYDAEWVDIPESEDFTVELGTDWEIGDNWVKQEVNLSGMYPDMTPIVDVVTTLENYEQEQEEWGKIFMVETHRDYLTFYATEQTTIALDIIVKVVR